MTESFVVPRRFNGPLDSGNGGYCAGVIAGFLEGGVVVSLRSPVPLETPLAVDRAGNGTLRVHDGDTLVAEATVQQPLALEPPPPPTLDEAARAAEGYRGSAEGLFSQCFVCGPARADAFGVFAGPVPGRDLVASPWTPPAWTADAGGNVRPELVWAVLDCPTYFAHYTDGDLPMSMLAQFSARLDAPVRAGEEHLVVAWPLEINGRKRWAGSAVLAADGSVLAVAHALLIEPRMATAA